MQNLQDTVCSVESVTYACTHALEDEERIMHCTSRTPPCSAASKPWQLPGTLCPVAVASAAVPVASSAWPPWWLSGPLWTGWHWQLGACGGSTCQSLAPVKDSNGRDQVTHARIHQDVQGSSLQPAWILGLKFEAHLRVFVCNFIGMCGTQVWVALATRQMFGIMNYTRHTDVSEQPQNNSVHHT